MYIWGSEEHGRLASDASDRTEPTLIQELSQHRMRQVAAGHGHCAAVTEEGLLFTWVTVAGEGITYRDSHKPALGLGLHGSTYGNLWPPQYVSALHRERVGSVAAGPRFTLVTTEAG